MINFVFRNPSNPNWQSVADRISELEKQHINQAYETNQKYTYLDPSKTTKVPNPTLKAFQKNAVQSYFERQQSSTKENANKSNCWQATIITNEQYPTSSHGKANTFLASY